MARLAVNGGEPVRRKPFPKWPVYDERELKALRGVLESGVWGVDGERQREFERRFASYQDAQYAVTVTSGTAALEIALRALGVGAGDEVIVPGYTFMATATAVIQVKGLPVFADVEPDTYNIDPKEVERLITDKTKAVIPVHLGGRPADMDGIMRTAKEHSIAVVEDACQAWGAQWRGRGVGSIGDLGTFSFQSSKNITSGEGGLITANDQRLYELCWSYHNCGRRVGGGWYEHPLPGGNYRMTEFQAAVLLVQLERYDDQIETRNRNAQYLSKRLQKIGGVRPLKEDPRVTRNAYHLYTIRYSPEEFGGLPRHRFLEAMKAEGIPLTHGYGPLHQAPFMAVLKEDKLFRSLYGSKADFSRVKLPVTERASLEEAVWLRQSMLLGTREDMDDIVQAIVKIKENRASL